MQMNNLNMSPRMVNGRGHESALNEDEDRGDVPGISDNAQRIEQSIAYMKQHLNKQIPVAKLAALVNVSPSHFFTLFKRWTGCAPIDFFIRLRTQHACQLLDATSLNVKEIAAALGYEDPFYFSRIFKSVTHIPPSQYRALPLKLKNKVKNITLPSSAPSPRETEDRNHEVAIQFADRWHFGNRETSVLQLVNER
jgi:AraC-like DNA-binding protein